MIQHNRGYSLLALVCVLYVGVVYTYQTTPKYIMIATLCFGVVYFFWGLYHHVGTKSLHPRIVLEYLLVATLGGALVATLLL